MSIGCAPWMVAPAASPLVFCSMSSTGFYLCLFFFLSLILLLLGVSVVVQICGLPVYARQSPLMVRYVQPSKNCRKKVIFFGESAHTPSFLSGAQLNAPYLEWFIHHWPVQALSDVDKQHTTKGVRQTEGKTGSFTYWKSEILIHILPNFPLQKKLLIKCSQTAHLKNE